MYCGAPSRTLLLKKKNTMTTKKEIEEQQKINRLIHFRKKYISESLNKASKELGEHQSSMHLTEKGERRISLKLLSTLYEKYNMNPEWFLHGAGPEILKEAKPKNTIDVVNELRAEVAAHDKKIQILEANINQAFRMIEALQKELGK